MHGNTPYAGRSPAQAADLTPEQRRALRRAATAVSAHARSLLPDEFVVGAEVVDSNDGPRATVSVRPPAGGVVSAGFSADEEADRDELARDLAAGAALEVKRALDSVPRTAQ